MRRLLAPVLLVVLTGFAVVTMAEFTMSRDQGVDPRSRMAVTVEARTRAETFFTRLEMTRALFLSCRLEVDARLVSDVVTILGAETFRFVVRPALNESDRRQLHGCLEDARIDQLQLDVLEMERIPLDES
ncbi:MAG: hypothetical protein M3179_05795 [Actinomycetota bacterium]|nr:hypothetical protein [Actinomycetota bacterium]